MDWKKLGRGAAAVLCILAFLWGLSGQASAAGGVLARGDAGPAVRVVQTRLRELGYVGVKVTGEFDARTEAAVKLFQKNIGQKPDGVLRDETRWALFGNTRPRQLEPEPPAGGEDLSGVVATAKMYLGVPYKFGGTTPKGFDCSGFVAYVFERHGKHLPRAADEQYRVGRSISRAALRPGDLVFFTTYAPGASHNGIYIGDGKFIHASSSRGVMISSLDDIYWKPRYIGARRVL